LKKIEFSNEKEVDVGGNWVSGFENDENNIKY